MSGKTERRRQAEACGKKEVNEDVFFFFIFVIFLENVKI